MLFVYMSDLRACFQYPYDFSVLANLRASDQQQGVGSSFDCISCSERQQPRLARQRFESPRRLEPGQLEPDPRLRDVVGG